MASISITRHPNSRWLYHNYVQVALARLYSCDFQNAIQTFKFVNTKSKDPAIRHEALLYLSRTFIEQGELDKADETFRFLEKEKLERKQAKQLFLERAYYWQIRGDYNAMVQNLAKADSLLGRKDGKARIYFIVGQVYQKLGFDAEAYNFYRKCLSSSPAYEIEFYARLNMAQVAKLNDLRDVRSIRKQFDKLLTDTKNAEFRDKIYFELGEFERKQNHLNEAIENYKLAAHAGTNKRIQGTAFLRTGQLYFDSLKNYSLAKAYYDSAVNALPKDYENMALITKRQAVLVDFVKFTSTIHLQDSLLALAALDSTTIRNKLDSLAEVKKKVEAAKQKKSKRAANNSSKGRADSNNAFFQSNDNQNVTVDWYFDNPSAIALGQVEFRRLWGDIKLEDNWRRSGKAVILGELNTVAARSAPNSNTEQKADSLAAPQKEIDPYASLFAALPNTPEKKEEALAQIEDAYFHLGDLYYLQLNEKKNAAEQYHHLLSRFPSTQFEPEVLYKLYLIAKEGNHPEEAARYAEQLKNKHPSSTYAKILINPNYLREAQVAAEKQKIIYKDAYEEFTRGNLRSAREKIQQAKKEGESSFTPQLELLEILVTGKTEDVTRYQYELGEFIKKYPDHELKNYAENLLAASKSLIEKSERARGIRFINALEGAHQLVILHKADDKLADRFTQILTEFNTKNYAANNLKTTNLRLDQKLSLTFVTELPDKKMAMDYLTKLKATVDKISSVAIYKFDIFVATKENFQILYRTKALDEYLTFFDRNYSAESQ
jgi:tetratricopeptide (TPR) repeat protein